MKDAAAIVQLMIGSRLDRRPGIAGSQAASSLSHFGAPIDDGESRQRESAFAL